MTLGQWNREMYERLCEHGRAESLRELSHQPGWETYKTIVHERLAHLTTKSMREATPDTAWATLQALNTVREFEAMMQELVANAVDLVDSETREQIIASFESPKMVPGGAEIDG
jgi:maltooligosyltrehalose synthase